MTFEEITEKIDKIEAHMKNGSSLESLLLSIDHLDTIHDEMGKIYNQRG